MTDQVVEELQAAGFTSKEVAQYEAASDEANARHAVEDNDVKELRRAAFRTAVAASRQLRGWKHVGGWTTDVDALRFQKLHTGRIALLSVMREKDGDVWLHGSISRGDRAVPTYEDLCDLHQLMGKVLAYQLFVPPEEHYTVRLPRQVLHLWAKLTGERPTPDFRSTVGTI